MNHLPWILTLLCLVLSACFVLLSYLKTKKTFADIEQMLHAAASGDFSENAFDESRLSALETRFAHYLSASEVSARNVAQEKDNIQTLISDISHQVKTPVSNLLLYSELLLEEELPGSALANAEAIHAQAEKLQFLIDALIKLSRLENGIITLSPRQENLAPMLQHIREQYTSIAGQKGLFLQIHDTTLSASCDLKWTSEALCNLVDNAIKYTRAGGVTLSVTAYEMFVRIDVSDTGDGISETEQAKIFSRFYRSESAREKEGVGIGLFLAREIISGEGGYIKVSSVLGKGSTFSIFLPR